jgi:glutathione peroxidase
MKRIVLMCCFAVLLVNCKNDKKDIPVKNETIEKETIVKGSIHDFKVEDLEGNMFDFKNLKGKKVMIVNTASKCGLTPQYKELQSVYEMYKDQNFVVVGFPANNFMSQEPGTNTEIAAFCEKKYGVTFPMMSKISVKDDDMHEVYQFLTDKTKNGVEDSQVSWNFQKYLLDENGELVKVVSPRTLPNDESIINWISKESI